MPERELTPSYKVERTEDFIQQFNQISTSYSRISDIMDSIDWALARKPHYFTRLAGDFYLWVTEEIDSA